MWCHVGILRNPEKKLQYQLALGRIRGRRTVTRRQLLLRLRAPRRARGRLLRCAAMGTAAVPVVRDAAPYDWVAVQPGDDGGLPASVRDRLLVHTVHDGDSVPSRFAGVLGEGAPGGDALRQAFVRERDWGADLVARHIAEQLGLQHYGRVRLARVLLDFNRFPGTSPPGNRDPLERLAINPPFSDHLSHADKIALLDEYDRISALIEPHLGGKLIVLGVHTYDELNQSSTSRPHLSLVNRPAGYQREARMPYGVFDPMYPDVLGESSCSRVLRDRISLCLERAGFRVSDNHPYALPEGSIEVRSQVWYFFSFLRQRYEAQVPESREDLAHSLVWDMLLNTNLRHARAEALRGYLHRYRKVSDPDAELFTAARVAYEHIQRFLDVSGVLQQYRRSVDRPSSLALEVRKDLLCQIDPRTGLPQPATPQMQAVARKIAQVVAGAIRIYFESDREDLQAPL
jgi:hypothetical protein